jgi:hypothetical protein
MEVDVMIKMCFFITDLHCHSSNGTFTVYHDQELRKDDFDKMSQTIGGTYFVE